MKYIKLIILYINLVVFLLGNIGIGVFTHNCKIDGSEVALFFQPSDPCDEHHHEKIESSCCHKEAVNTEDDCCSTDAEFIKIDSKYTNIDFEHFIFAGIIPDVIKPTWNNSDQILFQEKKGEFFINPPPILQGRSKAIVNQVFLI